MQTEAKKKPPCNRGLDSLMESSFHGRAEEGSARIRKRRTDFSLVSIVSTKCGRTSNPPPSCAAPKCLLVRQHSLVVVALRATAASQAGKGWKDVTAALAVAQPR